MDSSSSNLDSAAAANVIKCSAAELDSKSANRCCSCWSELYSRLQQQIATFLDARSVARMICATKQWNVLDTVAWKARATRNFGSDDSIRCVARRQANATPRAHWLLRQHAEDSWRAWTDGNGPGFTTIALDSAHFAGVAEHFAMDGDWAAATFDAEFAPIGLWNLRTRQHIELDAAGHTWFKQTHIDAERNALFAGGLRWDLNHPDVDPLDVPAYNVFDHRQGLLLDLGCVGYQAQPHVLVVTSETTKEITQLLALEPTVGIVNANFGAQCTQVLALDSAGTCTLIDVESRAQLQQLSLKTAHDAVTIRTAPLPQNCPFCAGQPSLVAATAAKSLLIADVRTNGGVHAAPTLTWSGYSVGGFHLSEQRLVMSAGDPLAVLDLRTLGQPDRNKWLRAATVAGAHAWAVSVERICCARVVDQKRWSSELVFLSI